MSLTGGTEEIGARVTLVGADKAAADAKLVSTEIKGIGKASEESAAKSNRLRDAQGRFTAQGVAGLKAVETQTSTTAGAFSRALSRITGVSGSAANGVGRIGKAGENVGKSLEGAGLAGSSMLTRLAGGLRSAEGAAGGLRATLSKVGGGIVIGAVVAGAAGMYEAVSLASKFNSEMSLIQTQAHASAKEITNLRSTVLSLAGKTAQSPEALATALYHIESNGLRGVQAENALTIAAKGASIGHANLVDVTNALGAVIASKLVPGTHNYAAAMGILNATVGAGDMHMQDLAEAMGGGNLAAVSNFGVKIQDVGAALAVFGDNNLRGAAAGTQLRMAVQNLSAPIKSGVPVLNALGLSAGKLGADIRKGGLDSAIIDLHNHLNAAGITGSKVGAVLTQAFGRRAGTGIITLETQFDRFQNKYQEVSKGAGKFGADWKATTDQTQFQFKALISRTEAWGISVGEKLIPKLEALGVDLEKAGVWLTKHKIVLAAVAGVVGAIVIPAIIAFGITAVTTAFGILLAWAPFVIFFGGIGALIYEVATHWSDIKQWAADAFNFVRDHVVRPFVDFFLGIAGTILNIAAKAFGWIPGIGGKIKDAASAFAGFRTSVNAALGDTNAQLKLAIQNMDTFNSKVNAGGVKQTSAGSSTSGPTFAAGGVKLYAGGGIVRQRTAAVLGEAGPEVVLPLNDPARMVTLLAAVASQPSSSIPATAISASAFATGAMVPQTAAVVPPEVTESMSSPKVFQVVLDRKVVAEAVYKDAKSKVART